MPCHINLFRSLYSSPQLLFQQLIFCMHFNFAMETNATVLRCIIKYKFWSSSNKYYTNAAMQFIYAKGAENDESKYEWVVCSRYALLYLFQVQYFALLVALQYRCLSIFCGIVWIVGERVEQSQRHHLLMYGNNMHYKLLRRFLSIFVNLFRIFHSFRFLWSFCVLLIPMELDFGEKLRWTIWFNEWD